MMKMWSFAELVGRTKSRKEVDAASGTSTTFPLQFPCSEYFRTLFKMFRLLVQGKRGVSQSPTCVLGCSASLCKFGIKFFLSGSLGAHPCDSPKALFVLNREKCIFGDFFCVYQNHLLWRAWCSWILI